MAVTSLKQAQAEARKEWERLSEKQKVSAGGYWRPTGFRSTTRISKWAPQTRKIPGLETGVFSSAWTPYTPKPKQAATGPFAKKVAKQPEQLIGAAEAQVGQARFWQYPGGISQIETVTPEQRAVSEAFGGFLASKIGQGLPEYTGPGFGPEETEAFIEARRARAERQFQKEVIPGIREAYRGPGTYWGGARAHAETSAREAFELSMREEEEGLRLSDRDKRVEFEYNDFLRTLPELSPVLGQALSFLATPLIATIIEPSEPTGPSPWETFEEMTGQQFAGAFA